MVFWIKVRSRGQQRAIRSTHIPFCVLLSGTAPLLKLTARTPPQSNPQTVSCFPLPPSLPPSLPPRTPAQYLAAHYAAEDPPLVYINHSAKVRSVFG